MEKSSIYRLVLKVVSAQTLVRVAGLMRDFLIFRSLGLSSASNDYFFFSWMQLTVLGFISVVSIVLIPKFVRNGLNFTSTRRLQCIGATSITTLAGVGVLFCLPNVAIGYVIALLISIFLTLFTTVLSSHLIARSSQSKAVLPGLMNTVMFLPIFWADRAAISCDLLMSANLAGLLLECLLLLVLTSQTPDNEGTKSVLSRLEKRQVGALFFGGILSLMWTSVDIAVVRSLGPEAVTLYSLASKMSLGISSVLIPTITMVILPLAAARISSLADLRADWAAFGSSLRVAFFAIAGTCAAIASVTPLVMRRFMVDSSLGVADVSELLRVQTILLVAVIPYVVGTIIVRLLQAAGCHVQVAVLATISLLVNVGLDVIFSRLFGLVGVAVATIGGYSTSAFLYYRFIRRGMNTSR